MRLIYWTICALVALCVAAPGYAQDTIRVLWWNAIQESIVPAADRRKMATSLNGYSGRHRFDVDFQVKRRSGQFGAYLPGRDYDVIVLDIVTRNVRFNRSDAQALQAFYSAGHATIMLDGSFGIRSFNQTDLTVWPGPSGSSAALLVNQIVTIAQRGGGVLIAADHDIWQPNSNAALGALLPGAQFQGTVNPSTDGDFIGNELLGLVERVKARDILRHWESVPNQGEAPIGDYVDFAGRPVTLYALVEAADKPGGGPRRPYISVNFDPGTQRTSIDSEEFMENLPTHKSGGS